MLRRTSINNILDCYDDVALKKRGVKASDEQLFHVASTFLSAGASIYDLVSTKGRKDKRLKKSTLEELRLMLTSYLANYLD